MKYDIARNEEGPLRRTVKLQPPIQQVDGKTKGMQKAVGSEEDEGWLTSRHPGLDARLADVETHLSVRYGIILMRQRKESRVNISLSPQYLLRLEHFLLGSNFSRITL
jgi:hypothetical protein